jgi:Flp pilus assembly protein TadB
LRLEEELRANQRSRAKGSLEQKELYELAAKGSVDLSQHMTLQERLELFVDQSGARFDAQRVIFLALAAATAAAVSTTMFLGPLIGIFAAPLGAAVPLVYLSIVRRRRINKLRSQLPDVFDLMSRMLRAGRTVAQAFHSVADEFSRRLIKLFQSERRNGQ